MSDWWQFDKPSPEDLQRDQLRAEIDAAERKALEACTAIYSIGEKHPDLVIHAAIGALGKVSKIVAAQANTLGRTEMLRPSTRRKVKA